jgi:hypothetical protein
MLNSIDEFTGSGFMQWQLSPSVIAEAVTALGILIVDNERVVKRCILIF